MAFEQLHTQGIEGERVAKFCTELFREPIAEFMKIDRQRNMITFYIIQGEALSIVTATVGQGGNVTINVATKPIRHISQVSLDYGTITALPINVSPNNTGAKLTITFADSSYHELESSKAIPGSIENLHIFASILRSKF